LLSQRLSPEELEELTETDLPTFVDVEDENDDITPSVIDDADEILEDAAEEDVEAEEEVA
jgi:hypothetical protein